MAVKRAQDHVAGVDSMYWHMWYHLCEQDGPPPPKKNHMHTHINKHTHTHTYTGACSHKSPTHLHHCMLRLHLHQQQRYCGHNPHDVNLHTACSSLCQTHQEVHVCHRHFGKLGWAEVSQFLNDGSHGTGDCFQQLWVHWLGGGGGGSSFQWSWKQHQVPSVTFNSDHNMVIKSRNNLKKQQQKQCQKPDQFKQQQYQMFTWLISHTL